MSQQAKIKVNHQDVFKIITQVKVNLQNEKEITIPVKVTPKSGKHEISDILEDGTIKIKLRSAPEQNKANEELIELLAKTFEIRPQNIRILKGQKSPLKTIQIKI